MKYKKRFAVCAVLLILLCGCSAANGNPSDVPAVEPQEEPSPQMERLRPGDEGFTFDYQLPAEWQPAVFPEDNASKIKDYLIELDAAHVPNENRETIRQIGEYYLNADKWFAYAFLPPENFWNKNSEMPSELYEFPVNAYSSDNSLRVVGGAEFAALNGDLIPYYVEAATHMFQCFYNLSMDSLEQTLAAGLYYSYPQGEREDTSIYKEINFYANNLPNWIGSEGAFLTDESLCYLASDGTIRVRGIILFREEYENDEILCGKVYSDLIIGVIPEEIKNQPWKWEFGDLYYQYHTDPIRPEVITEETYDALIAQYSLTTSVSARPDWLGSYGGE